MSMNPKLMRPKASGFNPRSISGLAMWLDASDGATLFQNSDGTVPATATSDPIGYWGDKSGNGRHVTQSISASRPTLTTVATKTAVNFDGTDDTIWFQQGVTSNNLSVFCVFKCDTLNGGIVYDCGYTSDNTNTQYSNQTGFMNAAGLQISAAGAPAHRLDSMRSFISNDQGRSGLAGSVAANAVALSTVAATYATTPLRYAAKNGNEVTGTSRFNGTIWSVVSLGARRNAGTFPPAASVFLDGQICEFLIYEQNLPQSQRRRVESYLATKWGITLARVPNADAEAWINNVYANGGSVSDTTAEAVNTFCYAIDTAGVRPLIYRLNAFCGTGLAAALTPLYTSTGVGQALLGTASDTNFNFVSGDYSEVTGLKGNGTNKRLSTGLLGTSLNSGDRHLGAYVIIPATTDYSPSITSCTSNAVQHAIGGWTTPANYVYRTHNTVGGQAFVAQRAVGFWLGSDLTSQSSRLWKDGLVAATTTNQLAGGSSANPYSIFGDPAGEWSEEASGGYSIGLAINVPAQAISYSRAWLTLEQSLGRVPVLFDPRTIPGIALWLNAQDSTSITQNFATWEVSAWQDKSGASALSASQSNLVYQPGYFATSAGGGNACIEFTSGTDQLTLGAVSQTYFKFLHESTGGTVFIVVKPSLVVDPQAYIYMLATEPGSSASRGISINVDDRTAGYNRDRMATIGVQGLVSGTSVASVATQNGFISALNVYSVLTTVFKAGDSIAANRIKVFSNNTTSTNNNSSTLAPSIGASGIQMTIGNIGGGGALAGVAEIIIYQGSITEAQRLQVQNYLTTKYVIV